MAHSLSNTFGALLRNPVVVATQGGPRSDKQQLTVRVQPPLKAFLEEYAARLGVSLQDCTVMALEGVRLSTEEEARETALPDKVDVMVDRFLSVFEAHEIPPGDVTRLLNGAVNTSELLDRAALADKLTPDLLNTVAELFFLNVDWLRVVGRYEGGPHTRRDHKEWYKSPLALVRQAVEHRATEGNVDVIVRIVFERDTTWKALDRARQRDECGEDHVPVGVAIDVKRTVNGVSYRAFDLWESQRWNYDKCRYDLKAIMLGLSRVHIGYVPTYLTREMRRNVFQHRDLAARGFVHNMESGDLHDLADLFDTEGRFAKEADELEAVWMYYRRLCARYPKDNEEMVAWGFGRDQSREEQEREEVEAHYSGSDGSAMSGYSSWALELAERKKALAEARSGVGDTEPTPLVSRT